MLLCQLMKTLQNHLSRNKCYVPGLTFCCAPELIQVNLDMTDSMGPEKLVCHMQNLSYTCDKYLICMGLGPSILSVIDESPSYSGPSYPSSPVYLDAPAKKMDNSNILLLTHSHFLPSASLILLKITWEFRKSSQNIWRIVVVRLLINISPSNVFQKVHM